jgi:CheY-like chemotaxis protein
LRILVVDDNREAAQSLSLLLSSEGHTVILVYDSRAALKIALAEQPQVVLLDIGLPSMAGYALARALRQHPSLNRTQLTHLLILRKPIAVKVSDFILGFIPIIQLMAGFKTSFFGSKISIYCNHFSKFIF